MNHPSQPATITVCCEPGRLQTVLAKMEHRAATKLHPSHEYHGLSANAFEAVLWNRVRELLTEHCAVHHSDRLSEYAFIVNAPLNDTVFMCTGVRAHQEWPAITFPAKYPPEGGSEFMLDFYATL